MATIKAFIRTSVKKSESVNVRFRLTDGRNVQLFYKSDIQVSPNVWDDKNQCIKAKVIYDAKARTKFNKDVADMKNIIAEVYNQIDKDEIDSKMLAVLIDKKINPKKYSHEHMDIYALMEDCRQRKNLSQGRFIYYKTTENSVRRYELARNIIGEHTGRFKWDINTIDVDTLEDFECYLRNEYDICKEHPELIKGYKKREIPRPKGDNYISVTMSCFKSFLRWCYDQGLTDNSSFTRYKKQAAERYGTPFYLTIDERNKIADFDLSSNPSMERHRDIFIFQCLIGCRISDLFKLTPNNVINGAIEYIPNKTKGERPQIVRVPLNERGLMLIDKYQGKDYKGRLFPFHSNRNEYNTMIKEILIACGINRIVTVLNKVTREEEKHPIYEVASSHMARRTFVGNLYKKVKDPNLVGALSGHKEGSKAFARYREIDEDIKKELIKLIE